MTAAPADLWARRGMQLSLCSFPPVSWRGRPAFQDKRGLCFQDSFGPWPVRSLLLRRWLTPAVVMNMAFLLHFNQSSST